MAVDLLLQIGQARPQLRGQRPCSALQNLRGLVTVLQHPSFFLTQKFFLFVRPIFGKEFFGAPLGQARRCTREELRSPLLASAPQLTGSATIRRLIATKMKSWYHMAADDHTR